MHSHHNSTRKSLLPLFQVFPGPPRFGDIDFVRCGDSAPFQAVVAFSSPESALLAYQSCPLVTGVSVRLDLCDHCPILKAQSMDDTSLPKHTRADSGRCPRCVDCRLKCAVRIKGLPSFSHHLLTVLAMKQRLLWRLEEAGKVERLKMMVDKAGELSCVASFSKCGDCQQFLGTNLDMFGSRLSLHYYSNGSPEEKEIEDVAPDSPMQASRTLYVSNIPERISKEALRCFFGKYGHVLSVDSGKMPLFAFVQYTDMDSVLRAISDWRSEQAFGRRLRLNFGKTLRWKTLWIKINALFNNADVIGHLSRFIRPERFYVDSRNSEMLVWFRRTHEAVDAFKKLRTHQSDGDVLFVVDYSSDRMDKYFFDRTVDIDSIFDTRRRGSSEARSSSINSFETRNTDERRPPCASYQRALSMANRIRPMENEPVSEECSTFTSLLLSYAVGRMTRVKDLILEECVEAKAVDEKKEELVVSCVYDDHSEESWPDNRKHSLTKRNSCQEEIYYDLFVPEIVLGRKSSKAESVEAKPPEKEEVSETEDFSNNKRSRPPNLIESEEEEKKSVHDLYSDILANAVNDEGISMYDSIKIRRYLSDPNNPNPVVPLSGEGGRRRKRLGRKKKKNSPIRKNGHDKKKTSCEFVSNGEDKEESEEKGRDANGGRRKGKKVKISTGLTRVLRNNVKLLRHHEAAKNIPFKEVVTDSPLKEEVPTELVEEPEEPIITHVGEEEIPNEIVSEEIHAEPQVVEDPEVVDQIEPEVVEETKPKEVEEQVPEVVEDTIDIVEQEQFKSQDSPHECAGNFAKSECPDSDSTITVVHPEDRACSPIKDEGCPGPPLHPTQDPRPQQPSVVYQSPFVYSHVPTHQYYYQPSFYVSSVDMGRPPHNVMEGYIYPGDFSNYCLQPVLQHIPGTYISQSSLPYSLPYIPVPYMHPASRNGPTIPRPPPTSSNPSPPPQVKEVKLLSGTLVMKNASVKVEYLYIRGVYSLAERIMPIKDVVVPLLRMAQRMHLVKSQIDEVEKRLKNPEKWCSFMVVPQRDPENVSLFCSNFIEYLSLKSAAGIVSYPSNDKTSVLFPVIYFIPPSDFSNTLLKRWTSEGSVFRTYREAFVAIVSDI